jgi:FlgD Ig-like domain
MRLRSLPAVLAALALCATSAHAAPNFLWSHRYIHNDDQWIEKVVVDPSGNIIVCGIFYTSLDLGQVYPSLGFSDGFVAKFDANGGLLWVRQLGDVRPDRTWDVAVDYLGNIIVVGTLSAAMNDTDAMVVKFAPNGTQTWLKRFGQGDAQSQVAMCVSTNLSKEIIIAGEFQGAFSLGGPTLQPTGGVTFFMAKLDAGGNHIWSKRFDTRAPYSWNLAGLATGSDGQTMFSGALVDSLDLGNGWMKSAGQADVFLGRFDASGNALWSKRFGDAAMQGVKDIAINDANQIALVGLTDGTINFGGGALTAGADQDPFVAVLNSAGNQVWARIFNGTSNQFAGSLAWASNHDLLVVFRGTGTLDFGGGARPIVGPSYGVWLTRFFGSSGAHRWSTTMLASGGLEGQIAEDDGRIILAGDAAGTVDLGGGETTGEPDYLDLLISKFNDVLTPVSTRTTITELGQNHPNPFNPSTSIPFTLSTRGRVRIEIYNVSGQRVTLLDAGDVAAGPHSVMWNGRDVRGRAVASGVYFYRLEGSADAPRKMVLLK